MEPFIAHVIRLNPKPCTSRIAKRFGREGVRIYYRDFAGRIYTVVWVDVNGDVYAPTGKESLGNIYEDKDGGLNMITEDGRLKNYTELKRMKRTKVNLQ